MLHKRNNPDPLLSELVKISKHNKIKIRLENRTTQSTEESIKAALSPQHYLIYT
jgi:hypothetical protein